MDYKIANQFLYTCDKYGNLGRKICDNVCFGTYDNGQKLFLVTKFDGKVETRDVGGNHLRTICDGAIEARFSRTDIIARKKDGRTELRDRFGNQIPWM
jgi:hypothetical protein